MAHPPASPTLLLLASSMLPIGVATPSNNSTSTALPVNLGSTPTPGSSWLLSKAMGGGRRGTRFWIQTEAELYSRCITWELCELGHLRNLSVLQFLPLCQSNNDTYRVAALPAIHIPGLGHGSSPQNVSSLSPPGKNYGEINSIDVCL